MVHLSRLFSLAAAWALLSVCCYSGQGTGFFVSPRGHLLTNHHVIDGASKITVRLPDQNKELPATVVEVDQKQDLALLKVQSSRSTPYLAVSRDGAGIGDDVFAVGYPMSTTLGISPKLNKGSISGMKGLRDNPNHYQMSVPIHPGNSGGPVIDIETGSVVGVVVARMMGEGFENVSYAIKSHLPFAMCAIHCSEPTSHLPIQMIELGDVLPAVAMVTAERASPPPAREAATPNRPPSKPDLTGYRYTGTIAGERVELALHIGSDKQVKGSYLLTDRSEPVPRTIVGDNLTDGTLNLMVKLRGEVIGNAIVDKKLTSDTIHWQGRFYPGDGRPNQEIVFHRPRYSSETAPIYTAPSPRISRQNKASQHPSSAETAAGVLASIYVMGANKEVVDYTSRFEQSVDYFGAGIISKTECRRLQREHNERWPEQYMLLFDNTEDLSYRQDSLTGTHWVVVRSIYLMRNATENKILLIDTTVGVQQRGDTGYWITSVSNEVLKSHSMSVDEFYQEKGRMQPELDCQLELFKQVPQVD